MRRMAGSRQEHPNMLVSTPRTGPPEDRWAALLIDPHSPAELGSALRKMLLSPGLRAELGAKGARRALEYRWDVCARRSWQFFERIAS